MNDIEAIKNVLAEHKGEIELLSAETMALQFLFVNVCAKVSQANPDLLPVMLEAFDGAANVVEQLSLAKGRAAGHTPETLRIIEQLRMAVAGKDEPRDKV